MKTNKTNRTFFGRTAVSATAVVAIAVGAGLVTAASPSTAEATVGEAAVAEVPLAKPAKRTLRLGPVRVCLPFRCPGDAICCVWVEKPPKR